MATHGKGTTLVGGTAGTIGEVTNITINETMETIDVTSMDSDYREFIAGWHDAGEITFTCNYDGSASGVADKLHASYIAATAETWTVTFPDAASGSKFECSGLITNLSTAVPFDDKITQDVTIKLTGTPVFTDLT